MRRRIFIPSIGFFLAMTIVAAVLIYLRDGSPLRMTSVLDAYLPAPSFFAQFGLVPSS